MLNMKLLGCRALSFFTEDNLNKFLNKQNMVNELQVYTHKYFPSGCIF